jgi:hypothetical protein
MPEYKVSRYFKYDMVWNRPVTESVTGGMWITGGRNSIPITLTPPQLSASTRRRQDINDGDSNNQSNEHLGAGDPWIGDGESTLA